MRNGKVLIGAALVVVLAIAGFWWFSRPEKIPTTPPSTAPAVGSCWNVDNTAARGAFPWPGAPVDCTAAHTAEVYYVGQVDEALIRQEHKASGDDKTIADNLMYAQARIACGNFASVHLGDSWHTGQVSVLASWITPAKSGFFGCALAQTTDAAGQQLASRTAPLKGALAASASTVKISCVNAAGGYAPCDQPHRNEFVGTYTVTPPSAPFNAAGLQQAVTKGCTDIIHTYLALAPGATRADVTAAYVGPTTATDWLGSDQTYACYAKTATDVRGSLRNLGTRPLPG